MLSNISSITFCFSIPFFEGLMFLVFSKYGIPFQVNRFLIYVVCHSFHGVKVILTFNISIN